MRILQGLKVVEFEGLGPGPFCGMLFADLGADVTLIARSHAAPSGPGAVVNRGKRSIVLDLKKPSHVDAAARIAAAADATIEGLRPGVMERLGLGPDILRAANRRLVYGRLTGWGQNGPLSAMAGHDINYVATSGAGWYAGATGERPTPAPTLVGDVAGGALYLAIGVLAAVLRARETGEGAVVDAAIVDGSAHMMNLLLTLRAAGGLPDERGNSMLDGAHFYGVYRCADGGHISVGPLEPKFYSIFLERLGLNQETEFIAQYEAANWPACAARLQSIFATKPRDEWAALFDGSDACVAPVLSPTEAARRPHMAVRRVYREIDGVLHAAAAPRFNGAIPADPLPCKPIGSEAAEILAEVGLSAEDLDA
ncbi:MAG: CoA transferase [Alphaproteobacteria bacterium]|nr:CoA transferase [Alphaproteobacteria bacterium]